MNSAEKPFENLGSHEQKIFQICGDIIAWDPGEYMTPEIIELREEATLLFKRMRSVNLSYDDSYYKYIAGADRLKERFEILVNETEEKKKEEIYINGDFVKSNEDLDILKSKLLEALLRHRSARTIIDWAPPVQENPHNDHTSISFWRSTENKELFDLHFSELFDPVEFENSEQVKTFYDALNEKLKQKADFHVHIHGDEEESPQETFITINALRTEEVEKLLGQILDVIKAHPRIKKPVIHNINEY